MADAIASSPARLASVPTYFPAALNQYATRHIFVCDGSDLRATEALIAQVDDLSTVTRLTMRSAQTVDEGQLHQAVREQLDGAHVGVHLYVYGDESFIWRLHAVALAQGMSNEEITLIHSGDRTSQLIYCVHCTHLHPQFVQPIVTCARCGVELEVRTHFSRRLGAYLGVCSDANKPYGTPAQ